MNLLNGTPHSTEFSKQEADFADSAGRVQESGDRMESPEKIIFNSSASHTHVVPSDDEGFLSALQANGHVSSVCSLPSMNLASVSTVSGVRYTSHKSVDPKSFARKWDIVIEAANRTVRSTTQCGLRTVLHPSLSRRFRKNDCQLQYRRLPVDLFADTLIANSKSWRGNKYVKVFGTSFGWSRVFPMVKKAQAHEGISLLFNRYGVPRKLVIDGSKEQTEGNFSQKARQADCWLK